jgi:vitamin B12 transporter
MKKISLTASITALFSPFVVADISPDEIMVITANRFEQPIEHVIAPIEVITQEEIQAIGARNLTQVLKRLPSIQITNQGGMGQTSELYVRGTSSGDIIVLMNGVRLGSATTGQINFSAIPLAGIQRIEFIRGSRAAVYGSDAIGGVINIITDEKPFKNTAIIYGGAGSRDYYQTGISASGSSDDQRTWGSFSAHQESTEGYLVKPTTINSLDKANDGYRNHYLMASLGHQLNAHWQLSTNGYYQENNVEYSNSWGGADETDNALYNIVGKLRYQQSDFTSDFVIGKNRDKATSYGQNTPENTITTNRTFASWGNIYQLTPNWTLGGGTDLSQENVSHSQNIYTVSQRDNHGLYALATFDNTQFQWESSGRYDDNEAYGAHVTWQVGAGWRFASNVRITASAGTAFKAPTFNELYWQGNENPNLSSETALNYEMALEGNFNFGSWRLAAYQNTIDDMIVWSSDDGHSENIEKARLKGIELSTEFFIGDFLNTVSVDWLDPQNLSTGKQLHRRAKQSAKWNLGYEAEKWQANVSYLYQGKRFDDVFNTIELAAYSLVDLSASIKLTEKLTLQGQVQNVLNEKYETAFGYQPPERSYYASLHYQL